MNVARDALPNAATAIAIGAAFAGGIKLGNLFVGEEAYTIITPSKAELEALGFPKRARWGAVDVMVDGALSMYDGLANTKAMAAAGSEIAKQLLALDVGGKQDWYLGSAGEGLLGYAADLKGAEAFEKDWYWTSTQRPGGPYWARLQSFDGGNQYFLRKGDQSGVFVVRRELIR